MTGRILGKADLHIHSYASNVTDYYAANTFAIPESYSDPIATYHELKRQGMSLVTLTDHNSIDGVREMLDAGLTGVFISSEMTTTFPEDGCNIHVTVANMTEAQFAEVNRLRGNVYEMLAYVDRADRQRSARAGGQSACVLDDASVDEHAEPAVWPRRRADRRAHREGAAALQLPRSAQRHAHPLAQRIDDEARDGLDRRTIESLANKHGILPKGKTPWLKSIVAGSDDHSGINQGQTWTEFALPEGRVLTPNDLVDAIRSRGTSPAGAHGGPVTLAHAMVKLLYDGNSVRNRAAGAKSVSMGGPINSLLRFVFDSEGVRFHEKVAFQGRLWMQKLLDKRGGKKRAAADRPFEKILASEAGKLLGDAGFRKALAGAQRTDDRIFLVVSSLVNRIFQRYVTRLTQASSLDIVRVVKEVGR
jgi:predicted metal-dependent phosphoesterase TrpH